MSYDRDLIALLSTPENISTTLEIAAKVPEVRTRLQVRFWEEAYGYVAKAVNEINNNKGSRADVGSTLKIGGLDKWADGGDGLRQCPVGNVTGICCYIREEEPYLGAGIWEWGKSLQYGIYVAPDDWKMKLPSPVEELFEDASKEFLLKSERGFAGRWADANWNIVADDFLIAVAKDAKGVAAEISGPIIDMLGRYYEQFGIADQALAKRNRR